MFKVINKDTSFYCQLWIYIYWLVIEKISESLVITKNDYKQAQKISDDNDF